MKGVWVERTLIKEVGDTPQIVKDTEENFQFYHSDQKLIS